MYTDHFGLSDQPFQLTPDARFWFESRTHKKAMAYLAYGLAQSEGFVVVTGEIGAGKSTLVAHLLASIDRARLNAIAIASTQVDADGMLRLVAEGLGVATGGLDKARVTGAVERRLEEEFRARKRTLLILDEAQNLPIEALEELRLLSNNQLGGQALIQIVLLGQPEFRDHLASPGLEQLRQRVIANHHLEAMGADEVEAYIRHRLALVGWQRRPDFSAEAFEAIHRRSGGVPRRINKLANRLLLQAAVESQEIIHADAVEAVAAEMIADAAPGPEERVLSFRSARFAANEESAPTAPDPLFERRLAALEARADDQEASLRRILLLLVDWVENGSQEPAYRTNAA